MGDLKDKWPIVVLAAALWTTAMVGMTVENIQSLKNIYNSMSRSMSRSTENSKSDQQAQPSMVTPPKKNPAAPSP